jgi:hypothetical protein
LQAPIDKSDGCSFNGALRRFALLGAAGLLIATIGAVVACLAKRFPAHTETAETAAGFLLLGGFALIGCALPVMI